MSDAVKKTNQQKPESYTPKKPEILSMAKSAAVNAKITYSINFIGNKPDSFETERIIIRHFKPDDRNDLKEIAISKENSEFADCDHPWPTDDEGIRGVCNWFANDAQFWAAEVKSLSKVICFINLNGMNDANEMDIGHVMNDSFIDSDYEYEALAVLFDYCFRFRSPDAVISLWAMGDKNKLIPLTKLGMEIIATGMGPAMRENKDGVRREIEGCKAVMKTADWERVNPTDYSPKKPEILNLAKQAQHGSEYPEAFILHNKSTAIPPEIKHYGPGYVPFANEFSHFLDYTGQGYGFIFDGDWCKDRSYTIADVFSGHAMQPSNIFLPEDVDLLWRAFGFTSCHTFCAGIASNNYMSEADMREAIKYALCTLGQPVVIPQESHWWGSIVIGYKDNGNTLVIYHYLPHFMNPENNAQPITEEISDWYNAGTSLFIAGKRENILSLKDIYLEGFRRIRACFEENIRGEKRRHYDEWEDFLRLGTDEMIDAVKRTRNVPGGEHDVLEEEATDERIWQFISGAHDSTWCNMAERRYYVMNFFRQAKEFFPEAKDALQALDNHFWYTNEIMGNRDNGYGCEVGDPVNTGLFKNRDVRARMADCVRRFRDADGKGLEMVEELMTRFDV